jgi:hypothetical protein
MPRELLESFLSDDSLLTTRKIPEPSSNSEYEEEKTLHKFKLEKFLKKDSVLNEIEYRNSFSILHWDPLSGTCFAQGSGEDESIPFDTLNTIFNEKNMWFNVQNVNHARHTLFSYDLENKKHWIPFLTEDMVIKPGQIQCQCTNEKISI